MQDLAKTFDWFSQPPEARDPGFAAEVKSQIVEIWREVRQQIGGDDFDAVLGTVRAGKFSTAENHAWAQTNSEEESDFVNLTLEIQADELSLNTVGWFKPQFGYVQRWLGTGSARRLFRELGDWEAVVFIVSGAEGKGGKVMFKGAGGTEIERLPVSETSAANLSIHLNGLTPQLANNEHLGLHLRRAWSADEVQRSGDLIGVLSREVERWLKPLGDIRVA